MSISIRTSQTSATKGERAWTLRLMDGDQLLSEALLRECADVPDLRAVCIEDLFSGEHRSKGHGRRLLRACLRFASKSGFEAVCLYARPYEDRENKGDFADDSQTGLIEFYSDEGFSLEDDLRPGAGFMVLELDE